MENTTNNDRLKDAPRTDFYRRCVELLLKAPIPFLVGGSYALYHYTGIIRDTKDLDFFIKPEDCQAALDLFAAAGFETKLAFRHWLAKATWNGHLIDIIFNSGNAVSEVDDIWLEKATEGKLLGMAVKFIPPEEMIWSKAFVMERERYDGADVNHILLSCAKEIDWQRLLQRFGPHWRVLLSHLVLFGFVYPTERQSIPDWVMGELLSRMGKEPTSVSGARTCLGTLLSRGQYKFDIEEKGFADSRLPPHGKMTREQIHKWDTGA